MATPSESVDPSLKAHTELVNWFTQHGGTVDKSVRIATDASRGVHLQVKQDWPAPISKETRVINTPINVSMSWFNAMNYSSPRGSFPSHGVDFTRSWMESVGPEETSAFFLMGQYLRGEEGFWYPYLCTLPQPGQLSTPLFFDGEDVDWVVGTGVPEAATERIRIWVEKYDRAIEGLEEIGFGDVELFTWELYLWASTIITSRAFSAKVLSGAVQPEDLPDDGVSVLLPLIDLPNHRPMAKVEWRAGDDDIGLLVLEDVAPGEEISNNYGPRNNEQLLINYGFCLINNPTDYRIVQLGVKPDSPLSKAKAQQLEMFPELAKVTENHYYIFNPNYPLLGPDTAMEHSIFSPALFNALTIMESNPREREMLEITEASIRITPAYGNGHCIYAALAQMSFELMAHAINLKASAEDLPSQPKTLNQTHAKVYRDSLITIDESALIIALWTISRGRAHGRSSSWEDTKALIAEHDARIPAGLLPDEILSRIRVRILERPSIITQNGELFRLVEMFNLLPAEMQGPAQACFNRIVQTTGPEVPTMPSDPTNLFATLICLFVATYNSPEARLRLPPRVTRWLAFLIENYPLASDDTENVHPDLEHSRDTLRLFQEYVTAAQPGQLASVDGVDWLASNSGWLEADWIRWSWTVASSEMVMLPLEPLQILKMDGPLRLNKQPVLYIPQE